jgi:hypothetical protein
LQLLAGRLARYPHRHGDDSQATHLEHLKGKCAHHSRQTAGPPSEIRNITGPV